MRYLAVLLVIIILAVGIFYIRDSDKKPLPTIQTNSTAVSDIPQTAIVAQNLDTPWAMVFLPDKNMLVTERPGRVRLVNSNGQLEPKPIAKLENAKEIGEGGLLGMAVDPDFSANHFVYFYYTYSENEGNTLNRVVRMVYEGNQLKDEKVIVDKIPGAKNHNGGRIKFGPDGYLYITTGDAENPSLAQNLESLSGKILRINDSKFEVYSYGHRNPQGVAWDNLGHLWEVEHGQSAQDELNLIEKGKNYGWPNIQGDENKPGMETPKLNSGPTTTWAPAGAAFLKNSLFFGGLRGQALYEVSLAGDKITIKEHFKNQFGRIRDVVLGPDQMLYITTSNNDGRGTPNSGDDKVIRINPGKL